MHNWKQKRVFVSGGAGVIGTALVNYLLERGAQVMVGDLQPQPSSWKSQLSYRQGDLVTLSSEEVKAFSPEIFFHLAATFERSEETPEFWEENFHHNILLCHHLLSLFKDLPALKSLIFASSYLVYDPTQYLFKHPQTFPTSLNEHSLIAPRNLCGMAKWQHEQELFFVKKFHPSLQVQCVRIFRSYGKNSRDVISRWIRSLINGEPIAVYCPEGSFDFIFAEDVAKGLLSFAETPFSGIVNLGTGRARRIEEVVAILKSHFKNREISSLPSSIPYEASQADMSLFHQLVPSLKFHPIEDAIPKIIEFEERQGRKFS